MKKGVDKKSKDKLKEENEAASSAASAQLLSNSLQPSELEPEEEAALELPPPMKPLQDNVSNLPPSSSQSTEDTQAGAQGVSGRLDDSGSVDYSDLEQIVKEKMVRYYSNFSAKEIYYLNFALISIAKIRL